MVTSLRTRVTLNEQICKCLVCSQHRNNQEEGPNLAVVYRILPPMWARVLGVFSDD